MCADLLGTAIEPSPQPAPSGREGKRHRRQHKSLGTLFRAVIPVKAGIRFPTERTWTPASAGVTVGLSPGRKFQNLYVSC